MKPHIALRKTVPICTETALLICCVGIAYWIRFWDSPDDLRLDHIPFTGALLIALVLQFSLYLRDLRPFRRLPTPEYFVRLPQALVMGSIVLWGLYYLIPGLLVGRGVFAISLLLTSAFLVIWRTFLQLALKDWLPSSNVLVVGDGRLAQEIARIALRHPELGMQIRGFVSDKPSLVGVSLVNPTVLGLYTDLPLLVASHRVNQIVIALDDRRGQLPLKELLELKTRGILIEEATTLYEKLASKISIESLKPSWLIFSSGFHTSKLTLLLQRILSIVASTLLLILDAPALLLAMVAIKLDSRGPVFHHQERVGQDGKTFTLWKFRSMREDAERECGPVWAEENDPRVTRVGRFLRRSRLDEFPQLFNVFRGEMNLVGPRPERPGFVEDLTKKIPYYQLRHIAKPGLTGWAQINSGYAHTLEQTIEKLQYDLFYVKNRSLFLDLFILLRTVKVILTEKGS